MLIRLGLRSNLFDLKLDTLFCISKAQGHTGIGPMQVPHIALGEEKINRVQEPAEKFDCVSWHLVVRKGVFRIRRSKEQKLHCYCHFQSYWQSYCCQCDHMRLTFSQGTSIVQLEVGWYQNSPRPLFVAEQGVRRTHRLNMPNTWVCSQTWFWLRC